MFFTFTIPGIPRPQGSAATIISRTNGKPFLKKSALEVAHRESMAASLRATWRNSRHSAPLDGPVTVRVTFTFVRPKSHYVGKNMAGAIRADKPAAHIQAPDLDKLCRLVFDALTYAGVWGDDSQADCLIASKVWGETPNTEIALITNERNDRNG